MGSLQRIMSAGFFSFSVGDSTATNYLGNGRQVNFVTSGVPEYNGTYHGKLIYDYISSKIYMGTSSPA